MTYDIDMIIIARLNIADVRETLVLATLRLMTDICNRMRGRNHQSIHICCKYLNIQHSKFVNRCFLCYTSLNKKYCFISGLRRV